MVHGSLGAERESVHGPQSQVIERIRQALSQLSRVLPFTLFMPTEGVEAIRQLS